MIYYQCALVSEKFFDVENWKRISKISIFPNILDQCGSPKGSTISAEDGTVHVIELFFVAIKR